MVYVGAATSGQLTVYDFGVAKNYEDMESKTKFRINLNGILYAKRYVIRLMVYDIRT